MFNFPEEFEVKPGAKYQVIQEYARDYKSIIVKRKILWWWFVVYEEKEPHTKRKTKERR